MSAEPLAELELLPVAAGALLELELLDEHAASSIAAPAAATPNATRGARGFRLPFVKLLKRSMHPRICHTGGLTPAHAVGWSQTCSRPVRLSTSPLTESGLVLINYRAAQVRGRKSCARPQKCRGAATVERVFQET